MYDFLIKKYVDNLTKEDILSFSKKEGITLKENELDIIYECIKNDWRTFYYGNPREKLNELKSLLSDEAYKKIEKLYIEAKEKISK